MCNGGDPKLFVHADYIKPARKVETIEMKAKSGLQRGLFVTEARTEELPVWNLTLAEKGKAEVKFDKAKSVFKPWNKDSPNTLK